MKVFAAVLLLAVAPLCRAVGEVSPEILTWVVAHHDQFMESYFTRPEQDPAFRREHEPIITVRITGESVLETQVTLFKKQPLVEAHILRAVGSSVSEQLSQLRATLPAAEDTAVFARVRLQRLSVNSSQKPQLARLYSDFPKLKVSPFVDSTLYEPSRTYQVWVTGIQEQKTFKLVAPEPTAQGVAYWGPRRLHDKSLIEWVLRLLRELQ